MSNKVVLGKTEFFKGIGSVHFEGPQSDNLFAFRYYNAGQLVGGKTMAEHFKFAMAYWHTLCNSGADPFGSGPRPMAWDNYSDAKSRAEAKMDAAFEFMGKLGLGFYCFHDYDLVEEGDSLADSEKRLGQILEYAKAKQAESGIQLLWGTANLFSNPRYMNGASTNPDFRVVAHAAAQVKIALDMTVALGGQNYVFWGGREGYMSLLNTNMKKEVDHLGRFLTMARDYGRQIGFKGNFLIEPKPCEPSKHQYDYDAATVSGFLRQYNLSDDFKLNLEVNHATLAGHTFAHEMQVAADHGLLGSLDANRGDAQNGWDTDQFPVDLYELTEAMLVLLESGGLQGGGINFDAKLRRNSTDLEDIFIAHIGGMDAFARALLAAQAMLEKSDYKSRRSARYASFDQGAGHDFETGKLSLEQLRTIALSQGDIPQISGKQEHFENLINRFI